MVEVASLEVEGGHNKAYVRFISASNSRSAVTAKVELDMAEGKAVRRNEVTVQDGDDLEEVTGRAIYKDCRIGEIRVSGANSLLEVKTPGAEEFLGVGQAVGDVKPRPTDTIYDRIVDLKQVDDFSKLLGTFLRKFKSGGYSLEDCETKPPLPIVTMAFIVG